MKIGYNQIDAIRYKINYKRKRNLLDNATTLCSNFISIDDHKEFQKDFLQYVTNKVQEKLGIKNISIEKLAELTELPTRDLKALQSDFKSINLCLDSEMPDFNIYAITDQEKQLQNDLQLLCDQLNKHCPKFWLSMQECFDNKIIKKDGVWVPNCHYIKNKKHKSI